MGLGGAVGTNVAWCFPVSDPPKLLAAITDFRGLNLRQQR